jgi:hypothetical protein
VKKKQKNRAHRPGFLFCDGNRRRFASIFPSPVTAALTFGHDVLAKS